MRPTFSLYCGRSRSAHGARKSCHGGWKPLLLRLGSQAALCLFTLSVAIPSAKAGPPKLPLAAPADAGLDADRLALIDGMVEQAIQQKKTPGCVVTVGRHGSIVFQKAYGHRRLLPSKEPMTVDTVFDMASITKPVATATSLMVLLERGDVRIRDKVSEYIPEFGQNGKEDVTVQQLLTHTGGLIPDLPVSDYDHGPDEAWKQTYALDLAYEPGTDFRYTDVGFLVLGQIVERVSGKRVDDFSRENIFEPLGMTETTFLPDEKLCARAATTEQRDQRWMRGEVHDPRAYRLGGVAGHAGLFSTADDLAVFAEMMLAGGAYEGIRVLNQWTVRLMTGSYNIVRGKRGLGWDGRSPYSSNRGELMSDRAFGHGGFTGTAIWIDPEFDLFVIFLSNRVHPDGKGSVNRLAGRIGTVVVGAIRDSEAPAESHKSRTHRMRAADIPANRRREPAGSDPAPVASPPPQHPVLNGIDVLARDGFPQLVGRRVGLITNHTGHDVNRVSTVELLNDAAQVELVALYSPEHGFAGKLEQAEIASDKDEATGLVIHSLYGKTRKPTGEMLAGVDTLVFDIQDIGTRFYTYISTMGLAMEAAAEHSKRFVVLDRVNPIGGQIVSGPVLDAGQESFVGHHTIPIRHGMTIGELARMFAAEKQLELDLHVVPVEGWRREMYFDETGLPWTNPSPNMRSLSEAAIYPGIGLLETTNLSVGRGTDTPFEVLGAPWLDGRKLAAALNAAGLAGVRFVPIEFTPTASTYKGKRCGGVNIIVTNRARFASVRSGLTVATMLYRHFPKDWNPERYPRLLANAAVYNALVAGKSVEEIETVFLDGLETFKRRRAEFLLY